MFDDEMKLVQFADDEKRVVYSVAMRPNVWIPRKEINGEAALVMYTEETADNLLQNFFKNNNHIGSTTNHNGIVDKDTYFFSAWKVLDPDRDPGAVMGLQIQKGDIILGQKIESDAAWNDVKSGKTKGFSFEAYLEPVLIENKIEMTTEEVDARIKVAMEALEEEKKAQESVPPVKEEEVKVEAMEDLQPKVDELTAENEALKAKIAELEGKKMEMSAELEAAKKVAVEMGAELEKGIKPNPEKASNKKYEEMSSYEKALYNRGKL